MDRLLDWLEGRGLDRLKAHDAIRRAVQSAAGAVLAWLAIRALPLEGEFVGILAAVLIVQPSAQGTWKAARARFLATVLGCAVGLAFLLALPAGWGTAVGLAAAMAATTFAATFRPDWSYGIVAAVALATTEGQSLLWAAGDRIASIALGAVIGAAVVRFLWHDGARHRFNRHLHAVLEALARAADEATHKAALSDAATGIDAEAHLRRRLTLAHEAADTLGRDADRLRERLKACEEMQSAIRFLDRAAAAPGDLWNGEALGGTLEGFSRAVARELLALSETPDSVRPERAVTEAQEAVTARIDGGEVCDRRTATVLAFAMDEVDRALGDLRRALQRG
ncbi:FUSC family protein [Jannaschia sp. W003]|uniref:FUSC family protein n=1 Tax=Jannaschia sp. W003 TaxID=2867012 RepID=UPI0021A7814D|nr:FUSC family protein [Jannaschia sp. W003]UWQ22902.1 FUSC family protein [Jannaschia sp. W003]